MVQLANQIYSRACKKTVGGVEDKTMNYFKTTTTKAYSKPTRVRNAAIKELSNQRKNN